jgi:hypothetical protein
MSSPRSRARNGGFFELETAAVTLPPQVDPPVSRTPANFGPSARCSSHPYPVCRRVLLPPPKNWDGLMKSFDGSRRKVPRIAPQIPIADQSIDQLTLEPTDPRSHRKEQPEQISTDIKSFGLNARIVIDCNLQCAAAVFGRERGVDGAHRQLHPGASRSCRNCC